MFRSILLSAMFTSAVLVSAGCQSNKPAMASADATPGAAVMCSKCQTTWVKLPRTEKGRIVAYSARKSMVCPDCRTAAENFFATGKMEHTCATCGPDAMEVCKMH